MPKKLSTAHEMLVANVLLFSFVLLMIAVTYYAGYKEGKHDCLLENSAKVKP